MQYVSELKKKKVEYLQTQIITCTTDVKTFSMELSQLKKTYQTLEINRQSAYIKVSNNWPRISLL